MIAPDMVGHGDGPPVDPALDIHDQSTQAIRDCMPAQPVAIVGHSFGATVALRLAIEMPERVTALVLYEPVLFAAAGDGAGRRATAARQGPLAPLIEAGQRGQALKNFLAVWGAGDSAKMKAELRAYMEARVGLIEAAGPALQEDRAGLLPRLGEVRARVQLVEGEMSPDVIPEINAGLAAGLADAQRLQLADAGHMGPITHAESFAAALAAFL